MLEWNIVYESWNTKKFKTMNIFDHYAFKNECGKIFRKYRTDMETAKEKVQSELMYYFWSKCEWELILDSWPPSKDGAKQEKVDVFQQVMLNYDRFFEYMWANKKEVQSWRE